MSETQTHESSEPRHIAVHDGATFKGMTQIGLMLTRGETHAVQFDLDHPITADPRIAVTQNGPIEFVGGLGFDPETRTEIFSITGMKFNGSHNDVSPRDLSEAYTEAAKGNENAINAIKALADNNMRAFNDTMTTLRTDKSNFSANEPSRGLSV